MTEIGHIKWQDLHILALSYLLIKRFLAVNAQALSLPHSLGSDILLLKSNLDLCDAEAGDKRLVCDLEPLNVFLGKEIFGSNRTG